MANKAKRTRKPRPTAKAQAQARQAAITSFIIREERRRRREAWREMAETGLRFSLWAYVIGVLVAAAMAMRGWPL